MVNSAIRQAVIQQVADTITNKAISGEWVETTLCKTLGIKRVTGKRVPMNRGEILDGIEKAIKGVLSVLKVDSTVKELKEFITKGGDDFLKSCIMDVPFTKIEGAPTTEERTAALNSMLTQLSLEQLWAFLAQCTKHDPVAYTRAKMEAKQKAQEKAANKTTTPKQKTNYVSCTNEEAIQILEPYYTQLASGTNSTPECFKASSNPTQSFQRFLFSHMNQSECGITNSLNETVYNAWKEANKDVTLTADELERKKAVIDAYKTSNPEYMDNLKSWSNRPYIKCLLKKEEVTAVVKK